MYFKLEYFRTLHYFYFYISASALTSGLLILNKFHRTAAILLIIGLINLYFSHQTELKVKELLTESRTYWLLSHLLIAGMALAYHQIFISRNMFSQDLQSTILITTYISIFTSILLILARLGFTRKVTYFFGLTKQHMGLKKVLFLEKNTRKPFEDIFNAADINLLKSYNIGESGKIDSILSEIENTNTMTNLSWDIKFLFIDLYEKKQKDTKDPHKKEAIKKIITQLKKQL